MLQQQTKDFNSVRSVELAEKATIRALLNSYLREIGITDPRVEKSAEAYSLPGQGEMFVVNLPSIGKTILGAMTYYSLIGQHTYGAAFHEIIAPGSLPSIDSHGIIGLLLEEMSQRQASDQREAHLTIMKARIENSIGKMSRYIEHYFSSREAQADKRLDFIRSEQSLYYGHPFHPYPKCSEGFADGDLETYSPEMGASFQLHYMAIRKEYISEDWLDGAAQALPSHAAAYAENQFDGNLREFALIPMHPWQANYVMQLPEVQAMMDQSAMIDLGLLGPAVYPTSSVRTVWEPVGGYGYKLPLHVRITNLVRENTPEQLQRTLDAAKVIHRIKNDLNTDYFQILSETGSSSVRFATHSEDWSSSFAVLYRPITVPQASTFVMASLLESYPGEEEPKLIQVIRQSNQGRLPDLLHWLDKYLKISMLPLLRILAGKGISFEAHLQNSLLSMKNGLPDCWYVRDLEGVSIDRIKAAEAGWIHTLISDQSPVLYEESEAWHRTKYYYFVNHLGSLIHTLAVYRQEGEEHCWSVVRQLLEQEKTRAGARLLAYIDDLLLLDYLPAKANFTSCFLSRGETPWYVHIPNPIKGEHS
ncbi:IucA/IucC family protein [Paenibacillus solisilvae]|uniref:IucA/IucC family protein n=1 Tax=Paenibacillus solisilvae TaxID=2486751 RepID=A0ABW0W474_9BACL